MKRVGFIGLGVMGEPMCRSAGIDAEGAHKVNALFTAAIEAGLGKQYWPVVSRLIAG